MADIPHTHREVHHHELRNWLLVMLGAFLVLCFLVTTIQRPEVLKGLPFVGPTATPTPIASENIVLVSPTAEGHIGQKFLVQGRARVFENLVTIRLKEKLSGRVMGQLQAYADAPDVGQFGDFTAGIELSDPSIRSGTEFILEVFQFSAKDGSEIDKISIPVIFTPTAE